MNFIDWLGLCEVSDKKENEELNLINPTVGTITSEFGPRKSFTTDNGKVTNPFHGGIDEANIEGTSIISAGNGFVLDVPKNDTESPYGYYVIIDNNGKGWQSYCLYGHLKDATKLKVGDEVKQGDFIGEMGQTGDSRGPHLHFEVRIGGEKKNPRNYINF